MPKIVISYRRSDSKATAGRIRDSLAREYGEDCVYMDVESIPSGDDYRTHIQRAITDADLLVAVIGPRWRGSRRGTSRISDEADPVRKELEAALDRKIPIIPVLVNDAVMPSETDLPDRLRKVAYFHAARVSDGEDYHSHIDRLVRDIDRIVSDGSTSLVRLPLWRRIRRRYLFFSSAFAVAGVAILASVLWVFDFFSPASSDSQGSYMPPSPRSYWSVGQSLAFLEATGPLRQFFLVKPGPDLNLQGAEPGSLLFEGRREGNTYHGKAYVFAGRCGRFAYDVQGEVLNADRTVALMGKAPQVDTDVCQPMEWQDQRLVFDLKYVK
ncbi:toll/interleukin-1 receptor domain-containing protein [Microvirga pakistanensis]|uniref:toll/interleukin-1 receptor domain-containing protein n=1 Tax=Microvirga pakistanensis TaxID=1682650 RepID=UPI00106BB840|nr:toll/interleukin-1 receptor domain-containing protein [Microvirga pakistanensis]